MTFGLSLQFWSLAQGLEFYFVVSVEQNEFMYIDPE